MWLSYYLFLYGQSNLFDNLTTNKEVTTLAVVQKLTNVTYFTHHIVAIMNRWITAYVGYVTMISFISFTEVSLTLVPFTNKTFFDIANH